MNLTLKQIIDKNHVKFRRYRKGFLYYGVVVMNDLKVEDPFIGLYEFPVPIEDCGDAEFKNSDKAIMFMRYIRKALEDGTFVKVLA